MNDDDNDERDLLIEDTSEDNPKVNYVTEQLPLQNNDQRNEDEAPNDRFLLVYIVFFIFGITTLLPYNMFINADSYFKKKFDSSEFIKTYYESFFTTCSFVSIFLMVFANIILVRYINQKVRVFFSVVFLGVVFIQPSIFVFIHTGGWVTWFFIMTLLTIVLINSFSAILQSSAYGLGGVFPSKYMQACMAGQGGAGFFASLTNIFCLAVFPTSEYKDTGFLYFLIGEAFVIFTIFIVIFVQFSKFYKYYTNQIVQYGEANSESRSVTVSVFIKDLKFVLSKVWLNALSVLLVFFVTLALFPGFINGIKQQGHSLNTPDDKYWSAVMCFLLFNMDDMFGRMTPALVAYPKNDWAIFGLVLCRFLFIPLFIFCNYQPRISGLPVLFKWDGFPIIFNILLGLSNGYLSTLCMMAGPPKLDRKDLQEQAGTVMGLALSLGLILGSLFSFPLIAIIKA